MGKGWIKLHRSIMDNPLWQDKPFSRGQAWIDMLMLANHADGEVWMDGERIEIKRGEFITSIRKLSERWGWSRSKTSRFISAMKSGHMVSIKSDTKKTTIKIWNYNKYQGFPETDEKQAGQQTGHKRATKRDTNEPLTNTNKNIKNEKEKKEVPPAPVPSEPDDDEEEIVWEDAMVIWEREKKKEANK